MSLCVYCKDAGGAIRVSYWKNEDLQHPISVQLCPTCVSVLEERGKLTEEDIHR